MYTHCSPVHYMPVCPWSTSAEYLCPARGVTSHRLRDAPVQSNSDRMYICSWARTRGTPAVEITAMTPSGHVTSSVTSPIDYARPISHRFPIENNPLSPAVSEIFSAKNGHRHTRRTKRQESTHPNRPLREFQEPGSLRSKCDGADVIITSRLVIRWSEMGQVQHNTSTSSSTETWIQKNFWILKRLYY